MIHSTRRRFLQTGLYAGIGLAGRPLLAQGSTVATIAGNGVAGYEAEPRDGSEATAAPINNPYGVVFGPDGALYFCEVDTGRTRRVDLETNRLSTVAGNGEKGWEAESRTPAETPFSAPHEIRWNDGNLFIVERDSHTVRRIDGRLGLVTTLAGNGEPGYGGDGQPAVLSQLRQPHSIAFDPGGNLLICDIGNSRLRRVDRETGMIGTIAGTGEREPTPDSGPMTGTPLLGPRSIDVAADGMAYLVLREGNAVYRLDLRGDRLQRIAGTGERGYDGDGGPALDCTFNGPKGIAWSSRDNSLYIVDTENHVIRRMSLDTGTIDTILGNGERGDGPDGDPLGCKLNRPHGVCIRNGVVYVTDSESHRIRAVNGLM